MFLIFGAALAAAPAGLVDVGAPGAGPTALIVQTPGYAPEAYDKLVLALERRGVDAWLLAATPGHQRIDALVNEDLPAAISALEDENRTVVLVGHGLGGTVAALAVSRGTVKPAALALLGAPLTLLPSPFESWLASLPLPAEDLDLRQVSGQWMGHDVLPLLLGSPLPPLGLVEVGWLADLVAATQAGLSADLRAAPCPVWLGGVIADSLGAPERQHSWLPPGAYQRFGYLGLDRVEPDNAGLLAGDAAPAALATWARRTLRAATDATNAPTAR